MDGIMQRHSLFLKYLLSYLIVLLIPTFNALYLHNQFIGELQEEMLTKNANTLNRVMYVVDSNVKQLDSINGHVLMNKNLSPNYSLDAPDQAMETKNELGKYLASNPFLSEIAIYFRGDTFIYSSISSYTVSFFINNAYIFENWSEEAFYTDINTIKRPVTRPAEDVSRYKNRTDRLVTFLYPLSRAESNPSTTLLFFVNESFFTKIIQDHFGDQHSTTYILDQNGQIITASNSLLSLEDGDLAPDFSDGQTSYARTLSIDKEQYVFCALKSKDTGWTYVSFTPTQQAFGKLYGIRSRSLLLTFLLLLLGSVSIFLSMKTNYSPIRNLKDHAHGMQKNPSKAGNEIEFVKNTIDFLAQQNEKLLSESKVASKDFLLKNLLKGRIASPEDLEAQGAPFGVRFLHPCFLVARILLRAPDHAKPHSLAELTDHIESIARQYFHGYVSDSMDADRFILILSLETPQLPCKDRMRAFQAHLEKELRQQTTIGVGSPSPTLKDIPLSYLEASIALDYRLIKGSGNVIYHDELNTQEDSLDAIPHKELDSLKYLIKQGHAEDIEAAVDSIINYIRTCNLPLFIARGICFNLVNITWRSFVEIDREDPYPKVDYPNVSMLADYETIDDLTDMVKNMCQNICALIHERKARKDQSFLADSIQYIQANCHRCDFSVQNMADHFGITLTSLSQYFKTHTGQTIIDYTTTLRIEKAKELLSSGDMNINDVCVQVGYWNTSSFIRRFKQLTGLTPGQYMAENHPK